MTGKFIETARLAWKSPLEFGEGFFIWKLILKKLGFLIQGEIYLS